MMVNGGWHDAGDLSQSCLTRRKRRTRCSAWPNACNRAAKIPSWPRAVEEAQMGARLDAEDQFPRRLPPRFSTMDRWTDGILGNTDDMVPRRGTTRRQFRRRPRPKRWPRACCAIAIPCWRAQPEAGRGRLGLRRSRNERTAARSSQPNCGSCDPGGGELWQTTGDRKYADKAIEFARQHRRFAAARVPARAHLPLAGFFYTGPDKARMLRYLHPSHEDAPVEALARLCELFPEACGLDEVVFGGHTVFGVLPEAHGAAQRSLTGCWPTRYSTTMNTCRRRRLGAVHRGGVPPAGTQRREGRRAPLRAAVPGVVRVSRQSRHDADAGEGNRRGGPAARESGDGRAGPAANAVGSGAQSVRAKHHVGRRLRLRAAVHGNVRRHRRVAAGWNSDPRRRRRALLAHGKLPQLERGLGVAGGAMVRR